MSRLARRQAGPGAAARGDAVRSAGRESREPGAPGAGASATGNRRELPREGGAASAGPARREVLPCEFDATVSAGLGRLSAADIAAGALTRSLPRVVATAHTRWATWLRAGAGGLLLPGGGLRARLGAERASAQRWLAALGELRIGQVDERALGEIVSRRSSGRVGARSTWVADCRRLRRWARAARAAAGLPVAVARRWCPVPAGGRPPRPRIELHVGSVQALLAAARDHHLRAAVALALGCGLAPGEMTRVRVEDVNLAAGTIVVLDGSRRGRPRRACGRRVAMPAWTRDLVAEAVGARPASARLLPRLDGRPLRWTERLRRVGRRAGVGEVTLADVRRLGQAIARAAGLPRGAVRGSLAAPAIPGVPEGEQIVVTDAQAAFAGAWSRLLRPPALPRRFPRRAPPGCRPSEPELASSRRRARRLGGKRGELEPKLPLSCLLEEEPFDQPSPRVVAPRREVQVPASVSLPVPMSPGHTTGDVLVATGCGVVAGAIIGVTAERSGMVARAGEVLRRIIRPGSG